MYGRLHVTKDEVCIRWREYFRELIGDEVMRDLVISTVLYIVIGSLLYLILPCFAIFLI